MGAVYLGYHEGLDRQVAIKVLNAELVRNQANIDRFYREAKSGALLNHPNIVRTLNIGQDQRTGKHYLVLEYVDGPSIRELLDRDGPLTVGDAAHVVMDVARALEHAHSRNVIHRDIKPDNILTTRSGVAKLADLGLAKRMDEPSHLTSTQQSFGTTHYMPYEQALNARKVDGRSDIYALGATFYHLVTGVVPFTGNDHLEVIEKKSRGEFVPASEVGQGGASGTRPDPGEDAGARAARPLPTRRRPARRPGAGPPGRQIPSFADPESARSDPWVQSRLAEAGPPTRLDLDTPPQIVPPPRSDFWVIRYRNKAGQPCRSREHRPDRAAAARRAACRPAPSCAARGSRSSWRRPGSASSSPPCWNAGSRRSRPDASVGAARHAPPRALGAPVGRDRSGRPRGAGADAGAVRLVIAFRELPRLLPRLNIGRSHTTYVSLPRSIHEKAIWRRGDVLLPRRRRTGRRDG